MKLLLFAAVALILGAMAAFMAANLMSSTQASMTRVVIVEQPIDAGKAVKVDQVKAIDWPSSSVPRDASSHTSSVVGRIALVSMMPGEPVLPGKLAPESAIGGLSSIIPKGKRAITVQVNEVIAVAGFALPGSYVDVLVSSKDANQQPFSVTVLLRVKVLAVAQETTADPDKPKVVNAVTLELTPHEAEKLDLARNIGAVSLVLRNEFDTGEIHSAGVRMSDIVNSKSTGTMSPPAVQAIRTVAAPVRKNRGAEEIRGTSRQSVAIP